MCHHVGSIFLIFIIAALISDTLPQLAPRMRRRCSISGSCCWETLSWSRLWTWLGSHMWSEHMMKVMIFYPRSAEYWRLTQQGPGALLWASERCCQSVSELPLMDKFLLQVQLLLEKLPLLHSVPGILRWMYRYIDRLLKDYSFDRTLEHPI